MQEQAHGRRLVAGRKRPEIDRGQQHLGILVGLEVDDEFIDLDGRSTSSSSSSCSIPTTCPSCVTSVRTVLTPLIPVASAIPWLGTFLTACLSGQEMSANKKRG